MKSGKKLQTNQGVVIKINNVHGVVSTSHQILFRQFYMPPVCR